MKTVRFLFVYLLKCSDGTYYTGITNNPERRFKQHSMGLKKEAYTYSKRPVEMVYCEMFTDFNLAIEWEKRIKNWSKAKKEALIHDNWGKLRELAACKKITSHTNEFRKMAEQQTKNQGKTGSRLRSN